MDVKPRAGNDARPMLQTREDAIPSLENTFHSTVIIQAMNRPIIESKHSSRMLPKK